MKNIGVVIVLLLFTKVVCAQASSSTTFEIEISLLDVLNDDEYEFFAMDNVGINTLSSCYYRIDSLKKTVIFSGHLDYIVGADVLTFIITQKTMQEKVSYGSIQNKQVIRHYIVTISSVKSIWIRLKPIELNKNKPFIEIGETIVDNIPQVYTKYYSNLSEIKYLGDIINHHWIVIKNQ